MILEGNGIRMDVQPNGSSMTYQVMEQTPEATETLRHLKLLCDADSGFSLKSNLHPSYKRDKKRFYLRGTDATKDNKRVRVDLSSTSEVNVAIDALRRLLGRVVRPTVVTPQPVSAGRPKVPGSTAHVRFYFIDRKMAQRLELTGKDGYPVERIEWEPTKPIHTANTHYNEHIAQGVDVLNKSIEQATQVDGIINPHKVTPEQAKKAVALLRECFDKAHDEDFLVAWWRIVTAIRGPDFVPCPTCGKEC